MKEKLFMCLTAALVLVGLTACGEPPQVIQGTVVGYSAETSTLVIKDELPPNAEVTFSLEKADIGYIPEVGNMVRLSYRVEGDKMMAVRVMDLSHGVEGGSKRH